MNRKLLFIPLVLFLALAAALFWQLMRNADGDDPTTLESALIGKPLPEFRLEALNTPGQTLDRRTLIDGKPLLLNVWATWCPTCRAEHQFLNGLAQQGVRVVGMNYKDDRQKAMSWLQRLGNPYMLSLYDGNGMLGLDLGVYGAPETFLIDGQGIIRWRHAGDLNERVWREEPPAAVGSIQPEGGLMRCAMVILLALMLTGQAWAAIDTWQFKDEAQEQAFREITSQLRCPKCQNNSIADSNAMIAADMRQKVYELMQQGKTKGQIVDYMVARYGHFVSYEPPLTAGTVLLWLGPGLFVLAGAGVIIARARRRDIPDAALSAEERQRLAALLKEGKER